MLHALRFNFGTVRDHQAIDALVYALSVDLWLRYGIDTSQPETNMLQFHSSAHCMLAQLALSSDSRFTVIRL